jgi:hypothetical protein
MLFALLASGAPAPPPALAGSYRFAAVMGDGTPVELTLTQTGADRGTIREVRWKRRKNRAHNKPIYDDTSDLYSIRAARDGLFVTCKSSEPIRDPVVTFTIGPAGAPKPLVIVVVKGTIFGVADRATPYETSARERLGLLDFLRRARFPAV